MPQRMSDPPLSVGGQEQQDAEAAGAARLSPNPRALHSPVSDAASKGSLAEVGVAFTERSWWPEAFSGKTWTIPAIGHLLLISAIVLLCSWLSIVLSHQSEGVATIWLSNGILFGVVITRPRQQWIGYFIAGLTAILSGSRSAFRSRTRLRSSCPRFCSPVCSERRSIFRNVALS